MNIVDVKIEAGEQVKGIDTDMLFVKWIIQDEKHKEYSGYRVLISDSNEALEKSIGNIYDSGRVHVPTCIHCCPVKLKSRSEYFVRIYAFSKNSLEVAYSQTTIFETALQGVFTGTWIAPRGYDYKHYDFMVDRSAPIFSKKFNIKSKIAKARMYICGLGFYDMKINEKRIGNHRMQPGITNYHEVTYYDVYDITSLLHEGENEIQVLLGNGFYHCAKFNLFGKYNIGECFQTGELRLLCDLNIYDDTGYMTCISTDRTWDCIESPVIRNDFFLGEHWDLHKSIFNKIETKALTDTIPLKARFFPSIGIVRTFDGELTAHKAPNEMLFDFGQNINGSVQVVLQGAAGTKVDLFYGESLGEKLQINLVSAKPGGDAGYLQGHKDQVFYQNDSLICSGGIDRFEPQFSLHAFRYVLVKSDDLVVIEQIKGDLIATQLQATGEVAVEHPMLARLYEAAVLTKLSNVYSIHADSARERLGYGGDVVCNALSWMYQFDMQFFHEKILRDFLYDQDTFGGITETAPFAGIKTNGLGGRSGPIGWQLVFVYLAYRNYQFYGNKRVLIENYDGIKKQLSFLSGLSDQFIMSRGLGDWCALGRTGDDQKDSTKNDLASMVFLYLHFKYAAMIADVLFDVSQEEKYKKEALRIQTLIKSHFRNGDGSYGDCSQSSLAFILFSGVDNSKKVLDMFIRKVETKGFITSGIFGHMMSYDILNRAGRNDLILQYLIREEYPGFGYMVKNGATTLWETFHAHENPDIGSLNHSMFSSYMQWYYEALGGITIQDDAVGANRIRLSPYFTNQVPRVSCEFQTVQGIVKSIWEKNEAEYAWSVVIPYGVRATVDLAPHYFVKDKIILKEIQAGEYHFVIKKKE